MIKRERHMMVSMPNKLRGKRKESVQPVGIISKQQLDREVNKPLVTDFHNGSIDKFINSRSDKYFHGYRKRSGGIEPIRVFKNYSFTFERESLL